MARKVTMFEPETLDRIATLYGQARPYGEILGIDPFLAMGGPAEDLDSINSSLYQRFGNSIFDTRVGGFPDWMGSTVKLVEFSHDDIERNIDEAKSVDQSKGVSVEDKWYNPTLVDLGYGNISSEPRLICSRTTTENTLTPIRLISSNTIGATTTSREISPWTLRSTRRPSLRCSRRRRRSISSSGGLPGHGRRPTSSSGSASSRPTTTAAGRR
jgi:hypothetical protein